MTKATLSVKPCITAMFTNNIACSILNAKNRKVIAPAANVIFGIISGPYVKEYSDTIEANAPAGPQMLKSLPPNNPIIRGPYMAA